MKCPICLDTDMALAERHSIEIDYCPKCRGIWLDRGEIDKMVEHFAKMQAPTAPTPAVDVRDRTHEYSEKRSREYDEDDDERKGKRKRGGFLENLMDILD